MSQTLVITFTDTEIRRQAGNAGVRDMRDARYPGVYFRFHQNRDRGTWHLVVGKKWEKIAGFPELPVKGLINALPKIRERLAADPKASQQMPFSPDVFAFIQKAQAAGAR